jgi:CheY-like chemotaxis protein
MSDKGDPSREQGQDVCDLSGLRVLLVEDYLENRLVLALLLEAYGAEVCAASGLADALAAFATFAPHILVTDIDLGDDSGFELVGELRLRGEPTPVVAISADADRAEALARGCQEFLVKPVASRSLAEAVRAAAEGRRAG